MGQTRGLVLQGGELVLDASAATTATTETFGGVDISNRGASVFTVIPSATVGGTLALGSFGGRTYNATTVLFRGAGLSSTGPVAAAGVAAISSTAWAAGAGAGTDSTYNKLVLPFAFVGTSATGDATSFATYTTATSNIRSLQVDEYLGTLFKDQNVRLSAASSNLGASYKINSLQMNTGSSLFLTPNSVLTIGATAGLSGAILATDNVTINNGLITSGANGDVLLYVNSGKTLTLNSAITGSSTYAAFVKSGTGTAVLNRPVLANGHYVINQGTVKLGAGNNTLWGFNQANSYLLMWDGTLDLNGTSQMTGALYQQNSPSPSAAVITSTNGAANLFINAPDARDYSGVITGPVGLAYGNTTATSLTLWADNTYTGPTLVYGGILQLAGNAKLSGTSSVELSYGALYLNSNADGGIGGGGALVNDRIPDAAPITMRAGRLYIYGRNWNDTQENLGVVTLAEGGSDFHVLPVTLAAPTRSNWSWPTSSTPRTRRSTSRVRRAS